MRYNYLRNQTGLSAFLRRVKKENKGAVYAHTFSVERYRCVCSGSSSNVVVETITRALFVWSFIVIIVQRYHRGESKRLEQDTLLDHMLKKLFAPKLINSTTKKSSSSFAERSLYSTMFTGDRVGGWCCKVTLNVCWLARPQHAGVTGVGYWLATCNCNH